MAAPPPSLAPPALLSTFAPSEKDERSKTRFDKSRLLSPHTPLYKYYCRLEYFSQPNTTYFSSCAELCKCSASLVGGPPSLFPHNPSENKLNSFLKSLPGRKPGVGAPCPLCTPPFPPHVYPTHIHLFNDRDLLFRMFFLEYTDLRV